MTSKCQCTQDLNCRMDRTSQPLKACPCTRCKERRKRQIEEARAVASRLFQDDDGYLSDHAGCRRPATNAGGRDEPSGISYFQNGSFNFFLTFLLETLGILIFFAIATMMFWISVIYYGAKTAVAIKNADRSVQMAAAGFLVFILVAYAVSASANRDKHEHAKTKKPIAKPLPPPPKQAPCKQKKCPAKAKASSTAKKLPVTVKVTPKKKGGCAVRATGGADVKGKCKLTPPKPTKPATTKVTLTVKAAKKKDQKPSKCKAFAAALAKPSKPKKSDKSKQIKPPQPVKCAKMPAKSKQCYSDEEGRAIFHMSRRYAIPTEMKQPPTLLIYIRDWIAGVLHRDN